jgi:transcriptional regulator with XRE-family HTH domain
MNENPPIGGKIETLRSLKRIRLQDLAAKAGLSSNQMNLIETGKSIPSLGVLIRIARALGIRLGTLLDDAEKEGPVIVRAKERHSSFSFSTDEDNNREHLSFYSLAPSKASRHMDPFLVEIEPGRDNQLRKSSHEGEEFIFVMKGRIRVIYGTDVIELEQGDSIYLDSIVEHSVTTPDASALILGVVYVPV